MLNTITQMLRRSTAALSATASLFPGTATPPAAAAPAVASFAAAFAPPPTDLFQPAGLGQDGNGRTFMPAITGRFFFSFANGRGTCACCGFPIVKNDDDGRVGVQLQAAGDITFPIYLHTSCFVESMPRVYTEPSPSAVFGDVLRYSGLSYAPRAVVDRMLRGCVTGYQDASVDAILGDAALSARIHEQQLRLVAARQFLERKRSHNPKPGDGNEGAPFRGKDLLAMLKHNYAASAADFSGIARTRAQLLDAVTDGICFGLPPDEKCRTCHSGTLLSFLFSATEAKCTGSIDPFTRCWERRPIEGGVDGAPPPLPRTRPFAFGGDGGDKKFAKVLAEAEARLTETLREVAAASSATAIAPTWDSTPRAPIVLEKRLAEKLPAWLEAMRQSPSAARYQPMPFRGTTFCVLRTDPAEIAKQRAVPAPERIAQIDAAADELEAAIGRLGGTCVRAGVDSKGSAITLEPGVLVVRPTASAPDLPLLNAAGRHRTAVFPPYILDTLAAGRRIPLIESVLRFGEAVHFAEDAPDSSSIVRAYDEHAARVKAFEQHQQQAAAAAAAASSSSTTSPTATTVVSRGEVLVDPACPYTATHQVFVIRDVAGVDAVVPMSAHLVMSDNVAGKNSFYTLQLLIDSADVGKIDAKNPFGYGGGGSSSPPPKLVFWRRYGRVGDPLSVRSVELEFHSFGAAFDAFAAAFEKRTGVPWRKATAIDADNKSFVKLPRRYNWIDRPTSFLPKPAAAPGSKAAPSAASGALTDEERASPAVNDAGTRALIQRMFNVQSIQREMQTSMKIDTARMPVSSLSTANIAEGRSILEQMSKIIANSPSSSPLSDGAMRDVLLLTNRYQNVIPRVVPRGVDPLSLLIATRENIAEQSAVLDDLEQILESRQIIELVDPAAAGSDIVHKQYRALKCRMEPLDAATPESKLVHRWFDNSQAQRHSRFKIERVWRIEREGEQARFDKWMADNDFATLFPSAMASSAAATTTATAAPPTTTAKGKGKKGKKTVKSSSSAKDKDATLYPRMLLAHGSSFTNFVSILSGGLKIRPSGAAYTGSMYNDGIYSSNTISKALNYSRIYSGQAQTGLALLNEVAVGKPTLRYAADTTLTLKPGEHSCWGRGSTTSDWDDVEPLPGVSNGTVMVPAGKLVKAKVPRSSSLLFDEIIVYNVAQVRMRYLVEIALA